MGIYDFEIEKRDGSTFKVEELKGKVLLIVNTATGCGFTPQYEALENLYKKYHDQGLEVLDFPCNQFGHQAPGSDSEIHEFCTAKYQTTFDQFKKIEVNGSNAHPLWKYLKENSPKEYIKGIGHRMAMGTVKGLGKTCKSKEDIKWNFTKFLVSKDGEVVSRYSPIESPMKMEDIIIQLLSK